MQLNIWFGHLLSPALDLIDQEAPDILCVQEVVSSPNGYPLFDTYQTHERLSEKFSHQFLAPTFSFEALGETCDYGNAIYSKYPISEEHVEFTHGAYDRNLTIKTAGSNIRNIQHCKITLSDGKTVTIANHHGFHNRNADGSDESAASMRKAAAILQGVGEPLILCGDLNVNPNSDTIRELDPLQLRNLSSESKLKTTLSSAHRFTYDLVSDYILVSPTLDVESFHLPDAVVSDHKALIATINV